MIKERLESIGMGKNEISTYLALIQHGDLSATEISRKSGVHRVNVYDATAQLINKGLVSELPVDGKKMYRANDPKHLLTYVKTKEQRIQEILPELEKTYSAKESSAETFYGEQGLKMTILEMARSGEHIVAFGIPKAIPDRLGAFLDTFHRERIKHKTTIDHIYNEDARERIEYLNTVEGSRAKHLDSSMDSPATTIIYGNTVMFWIFSDEIFTVRIKSKEMTDAYRRYFDLLWEQAS